MSDLISTVNHLAQAVQAWAVIIAAIVGAVQATKWGKAQSVKTAATTAAAIRDAAKTAVQATEQLAAVTGAANEEKRADAIQRVNAFLPASIQPAAGQVETAVEAAVHLMNAEKARAGAPAPAVGAEAAK